MTTTTPAGWYPDPDGAGLRWWDGATWTTHEHQASPVLDAVTARTIADFHVARVRRLDWPADTTNSIDHELMDLPAHHRSAMRWAFDELTRALHPDEPLVHVDGRAQGMRLLRSQWVRGTVVALTTARAVAVVADVPVRGDGARQGVEVEVAPLTAIDIKGRPRPRLTRDTLVTRSVRGKLELAARTEEVLRRWQAFVRHPQPGPSPELVALLTLPPVDPAAPPADWYPDPASGPGVHRWWDGFQWTEQTARRGELGVEYGWD